MNFSSIRMIPNSPSAAENQWRAGHGVSSVTQLLVADSSLLINSQKAVSTGFLVIAGLSMGRGTP